MVPESGGPAVENKRLPTVTSRQGRTRSLVGSGFGGLRTLQATLYIDEAHSDVLCITILVAVGYCSSSSFSDK